MFLPRFFVQVLSLLSLGEEDGKGGGIKRRKRMYKIIKMVIE